MDEQNEVEANEPNGEEAIDYKAKYEETLKHSRDWEKRAKANKAAKDELDKLKEAQMTETEKLQKQVSDYKAAMDALQAEKDKAAWVKEISAETGVKAEALELIGANDRDDLLAKANALAAIYGAKDEEPAPSVPVVLGDGNHADHTPAGSAEADFAQFFNQL